MGHVITEKGVMIDDDKVKAIRDMTPPTDVKSLRSFLGMVNYLSKFIPNLATESKLLRDLEKKNVDWNWLENHQDTFIKLKDLIAQEKTLSFFDPKKPVQI